MHKLAHSAGPLTEIPAPPPQLSALGEIVTAGLHGVGTIRRGVLSSCPGNQVNPAAKFISSLSATVSKNHQCIDDIVGF